MTRKKKGKSTSRSPRQKAIEAEFRVLSVTERPLEIAPETETETFQNPFHQPNQPHLRFRSQSSQERAVDEQAIDPQQLEPLDAIAVGRATDVEQQLAKCIGCQRTELQVKLKEHYIGPVPVFYCNDCKRVGKSIFNILFK